MKDLEDIIRATDRILNKLTKKQKLQKTNKNWIMAVDEYNFIVSVDGYNNYMFWQRVQALKPWRRTWQLSALARFSAALRPRRNLNVSVRTVRCTRPAIAGIMPVAIFHMLIRRYNNYDAINENISSTLSWRHEPRNGNFQTIGLSLVSATAVWQSGRIYAGTD